MLATRPRRMVSNNGRQYAPVELSLKVQRPENDYEPSGERADLSPVLGLIHVLRQLAEVIAGLSPDEYTARPVGAVTSSIGCHVRHCLDHVNAFLEGIEVGLLDYDSRQRGTSIEHDRHAAFELVNRMEDRLWGIDSNCLSQPVSVKVMPTSNGPGYCTSSSVGRELAFVQNHTIHHGAIIAMTCRILGAELPEGIGYAPATIAFLDRKASSPTFSSP